MKIFLLSFFLLYFFPTNREVHGNFEKGQILNDSSFGMSPKELKVLEYMNIVRTDPDYFKNKYLTPYLDSVKRKPDKWVRSLLKDLDKHKPCGKLVPQEDLHLEASKHAEDLGNSGKASHSSSKGLSYPKRTKYLLAKYSLVSENCQFGYIDPLSIVIDLLIDENIPDLGHRKTILNPELVYAGVSIKPHKKFGYNCVIEFAGKLIK